MKKTRCHRKGGVKVGNGWLAVALVGALGLGPESSGAQPLLGASVLEPPAAGGVAELDRALAKLSGHRRLLMIAAHPDDEDNSLLTLVERGWGGDAAYLSLSRGEGGQNLIGEELGVGLGLLRSRELLSARSVDGGRQFFSRAYDFGYTRSLAEAEERWPKQELLKDAVRVIRRFRPQVVVATFPPDARAGHGQHQLSAIVAEEAFALAGDPQAFPELLEEGLGPWQPEAFYRSGWFDREAPAVTFPLGGLDAIGGRSIWQISRASRSRHRSQDMGSLQSLGSPENRWVPAAGRAMEALKSVEGGAPSEGPFTGIDTSLGALAATLESIAEGELAASLRQVLGEIEAQARDLRQDLSPRALSESRPEIARRFFGLLEDLWGARALVAGVQAGVAPPASPLGSVAVLLDEKVALAERAVAAAFGLVFDATTSSDRLIPGQPAEVTITVWNAGSAEPPGALTVRRVDLLLPRGWEASELGDRKAGAAVPLGASQLETWTFTIHMPEDAAPSMPYFLERPRLGDLYDWTGVAPEILGTPFEPPPVKARIVLELPLQPTESLVLELDREVVQRYADQAVGEVRRPLRVVPTLEVSVEPNLLIWRLKDGDIEREEGRPARRGLAVRLANLGRSPQQGQVEVTWIRPRATQAPELTVPPQAFHLAGGAQEVLNLDLSMLEALPPGGYRLEVAAVTADGRRFRGSMPVLDYPHVRPTPLPVAATAELRIGAMELPALGRLGYVRGAADRVPEALRRIGLEVELLGPEALATGDLSVYDAIVVGSRAYETDPALRQANGRLLAYVKGGGRLVVQFQQYAFVQGGFAPFRLDIARPHDRVTDEGSAIEILDPAAAVFLRPNEIQPQDWDGWVQERGLYFAGTWDSAYTPLLSVPGPNGEELRGGLLEARVGEGTYVYTGLAFFRQLPAGVVGAYRLFLNLLAPPG